MSGIEYKLDQGIYGSTNTLQHALHFKIQNIAKCKGCQSEITSTDQKMNKFIRSHGYMYHLSCFHCGVNYKSIFGRAGTDVDNDEIDFGCKVKLSLHNVYDFKGVPFCSSCYSKVKNYHQTLQSKFTPRSSTKGGFVMIPIANTPRTSLQSSCSDNNDENLSYNNSSSYNTIHNPTNNSTNYNYDKEPTQSSSSSSSSNNNNNNNNNVKKMVLNANMNRNPASSRTSNSSSSNNNNDSSSSSSSPASRPQQLSYTERLLSLTPNKQTKLALLGSFASGNESNCASCHKTVYKMEEVRIGK